MVDAIPITPSGYEKIKEEVKRLKTVERPAIINEIATARALGDLSENAEYHSARERQGFIEGRILELEGKLSLLQVVELGTPGPTSRVIFGTKVELAELSEDDGSHVDVREYQIVGELEADVKNNRISIASPLARALINKEVGDIVTVQLPRGTKEYEIVSISF